MLVWPFVPFLHQGSQCCGGSVEYVHFMFLYYLPESSVIRIVWYSFIHHCCGAICHWPVEDIRMSRDPPDIGSAPVNITRMIIKYVMMGCGGIDHISSSGMHNPFRFSSRPTGVQYEERVFRIHLFGSTSRICRTEGFVPPYIPSIQHIDSSSCAFYN